MLDAVGSYFPFSQNEIIPLLTCNALASSGCVRFLSNLKYFKFCAKKFIILSLLIIFDKYLIS